jgi:hypothetical protein
VTGFELSQAQLGGTSHIPPGFFFLPKFIFRLASVYRGSVPLMSFSGLYLAIAAYKILIKLLSKPSEIFAYVFIRSFCRPRQPQDSAVTKKTRSMEYVLQNM